MARRPHRHAVPRPRLTLFHYLILSLVLVSLAFVNAPQTAANAVLHAQPPGPDSTLAAAAAPLLDPAATFCSNPVLCSACVAEQAAQPSEYLLGTCATLASTLTRGGNDVSSTGGPPAGGLTDNGEYIPPADTMGFDRGAILAAGCSPEVAATTAYGISTTALGMALGAAGLACAFDARTLSTQTLLSYLVNTVQNSHGVSFLGCVASYNGYNPQGPGGPGTINRALVDCYVTNLYAYRFAVPNLNENSLPPPTVQFPQSPPTLKSTLMRALGIHAVQPVTSLHALERLYPALSAMTLLGYVLEQPNATLWRPSSSSSSSSAAEPLPMAPLGSEEAPSTTAGAGSGTTSETQNSTTATTTASNATETRDATNATERPPDSTTPTTPTFAPAPSVRTRTRTVRRALPPTPAPTFAPAPIVRTMTKTLVPPLVPTSSSSSPATEASTTETTTATTTSAATTTTFTPAPTTSAPATTSATPTNPTTPPGPLNTFKNVASVPSQALLFAWVLAIRRDVADISPADATILEALALNTRQVLAGLLCAPIAGMQSPFTLPSTVTIQSDPVAGGYRTTHATQLDSEAQLTVLAALGSASLDLEICGYALQGQRALPVLAATIRALAVTDNGGAVTGLARTDPTTGATVPGTDAPTTALGIAAAQQVLQDISGFISPEQDDARTLHDFLRHVLKNSAAVAQDNCAVAASAYWPPPQNASLAGLVGTAGRTGTCGGIVPTLTATALAAMAVGEANFFRATHAKYRPMPPTTTTTTTTPAPSTTTAAPQNQNADSFFTEHKYVIIGVGGGAALLVVGAVIVVVSMAVLRHRRASQYLRSEELLLDRHQVPTLSNSHPSSRQSEPEPQNLGFF